MKQSLVFVGATLILIILCYVAISIDSWEAAEHSAAADQYVTECLARTPEVVTIAGQAWDLSACG